MLKLETCRVEGNARDALFGRFGRVVLAVADYRMARRRKLHSDLILKSRDQSRANERSAFERALYGVAKFRARACESLADVSF